MKKNIKVLIVGSHSSVKGGITSVIDRFLNYNWNDIEVELLSTYIEGNFIKKIFFFLRGFLKFIKMLIKNDFDIAHIHMSYKGSFFRKYLIVKFSKLFKKKVILHLHGSEFEIFYNNSNQKIKNMIKNLLESVDSVIVLGENWERIIKSIAPNAKIDIFKNAVNVPDYKAQWSDEKINILFLGVLIKRKGIYELIEAINELNKNGVIKNKKLNFLIAGSGIEEKSIKNKINEYNISYCVEMLGWINRDMKEMLFNKSQIFILPSYNEGLPMAILEAMSYGIPVISTDVGSVSEVVINDKTGYLISPGSIKEIIESIKLIIANENAWKAKSSICKKIIEEEFNEEKYFKKIEHLYKYMLNR